jgi:MGT family glycosyltransferase
MARVAFVVPPLTGHTNPTVSVGRALAQRGHDIAWVGYPDIIGPLLPPGAELLPVADEVPAEMVATVEARGRGQRGMAALKFLWQDFLMPLAREMLPAVDDAIGKLDPDVVVVDQQALAGAAVAIRRGLPWATSATTSAELTDPLATMPRLDEWVHEWLTSFADDAGIGDVAGTAASAAARVDLRFSPHLVVAFTTETLVGGTGSFPPHYAFVGPSISDRPDPTPFDWNWLDGRPLIFVSLGTVNGEDGSRFFGAAFEALDGMPVQAVVVAPPDLVRPAPDNVHVAARVPQLALLPHCDVVVTHCGHNTVCESLAHGLPLVLAPIRDDQPIIADQVTAAGAGVRVKFGRVTAPQLAAAIGEAMSDPKYREGANRVQASFNRAGGPAEAAMRVEALVPTAGATPALTIHEGSSR